MTNQPPMPEDTHNETNPGIDIPEDAKMHIPEGHEPEEETASYLGPILGVLIVVLVLILGGLYLWGRMLVETPEQTPTPIENNEPETPRAEADADILDTVSSSNSIDAIEADLESTDLESLDAELNAIDAELNMAQ